MAGGWSDEREISLMSGRNIFYCLKTNKFKVKVKKYDEKQVIDNAEEFFANNLNKSLFDSDKIIIINRCTDKIINKIEELIDRDLNDIIFILRSEVLEKRSKLRNFFEKSKKKLV